MVDQPKGYKVEEIFVEGRKYETFAASRQCLETLDPKQNIDSFKRNQGRETCMASHLYHKGDKLSLSPKNLVFRLKNLVFRSKNSVFRR